MSENELENSQKVLLKLLENALKGKTAEPCRIDKDVVKESVFNAVTLLAYDAAKECECGEKLREQWKKLSSKELYTNIKINSQHNTLHKIMTENNIRYCVIKGCSSAWYYPYPEKRAMGDVDFMVHKDDFEAAMLALKNNGFSVAEMEHACHKVLKSGDMHFEMHFEPPGIPDGECGEIIRGYLSDIFESCKLSNISDGEFVKPSDFHHGIILFLHTYHHMFGEGIGLRHLCDFAVFINRFSDKEFCDLFEEKLKAVGIWRFVSVMGALSERFLKIAHKNWFADNEEEFLSLIINDILKGGNLGKKDKERAVQSMMISQRGKHGISDNRITTLIKSANNSAYYQFKFLRKHKFLRSFGFIFLGSRYIFRVMFRNRKKVSVKNMISGSKERREIYKRFDLYKDNK